MLESTLEQAVRKHICQIGGRCYKWVCPGEAGGARPYLHTPRRADNFY